MNEKSFLIAYDLDTTVSEVSRGKPLSQVYVELADKIKQYGTWAQIQQSCWSIVTTSSASSIRDDIREVLHDTDRLLVLQSANVAAWQNPICSNKWMKEHL